MGYYRDRYRPVTAQVVMEGFTAEGILESRVLKDRWVFFKCRKGGATTPNQGNNLKNTKRPEEPDRVKTP